MRVPGANMLRLARRAVRFETLGLRVWLSRTTDDRGRFVPVYAGSVDIQGSMQPVDAKLYQQLGLNFKKSYRMLWTSADVQPTDRDRDGDLITYGGRTWLAESDVDWMQADGFRVLLCVEVPPDA